MAPEPELRKDPVQNRWVLIAPRPPDAPLPAHPEVPETAPCPLCARAGELPAGATSGVVSALEPVLDRRSPVDRARAGGELYTKMSGAGEHEIILETAAHDVTLAELPVGEVEGVLRAYRERFLYLRQDNRFRHIVVVKNQGRAAGARAEHAYAEAYALPLVPPSVREKIQGIQGYHRRTGSCAYCDLVRHERAEKTRRVAESMRHLALAPWASRSPFELLVLPKGHHADFAESSDADLGDLAALLVEVLGRLQRVVDEVAFQLVVQSAPPDMGADLQQFHWHLEIHPRLPLPEALGEVIDVNPVAPEDAARLLREAVL